MNKYKYIIGVIVGISIVGFGIFALSSDSTETDNNSQQTLGKENENVNEYELIRQEIENGEAIMLDVRTAGEYASGHVAEALNLDVQAIAAGAQPDVDLSQKIYLYCRSGNRSVQAAQLLKNNGYSNIVDLGGIQDMLNIGATITAQ